MRKVVLRFPEVGHEPTERPQACPRCGHTALQGWGTVEKRVFDTHGWRTVIARRYRCTGCGRTFLFYPEGVTRRWRSERVVRLCGLMWGLGVSVRGIVVLLEQFGIRAGRMTVWRDIRAVGEQVKRAATGGKVRVLGVDGFRVRVRGQGRGMVVALDMGEGLPVVMLEVDETDPQAMQEALAPLVKALGVEVVVTDDLGCFRSVTEGLAPAQAGAWRQASGLCISRAALGQAGAGWIATAAGRARASAGAGAVDNRSRPCARWRCGAVWAA